MDWKLELIVVPVSDVDRAKSFYLDQLGFEQLVDHSPNDSFRIVQLTPHGSACAIAFGQGLQGGEPGSTKGLHLIVNDIEAARDALVGRGAPVSGLFHFEDGGQTDGPDPKRSDYNTFFSFDDPDGNAWLVQEVGRQAP
jgi:catechol 2,3-dioxygenase-like lactoylglutathione lyase family enzyme